MRNTFLFQDAKNIFKGRVTKRFNFVLAGFVELRTVYNFLSHRYNTRILSNTVQSSFQSSSVYYIYALASFNFVHCF